MMLSYHYWLCTGKNGNTEVKSVQRDGDSHSGGGCLALHPTLRGLFNTFLTKRCDGFIELSHISLRKEINRIRSLHIPARHLFPGERARELQSHSLLPHSNHNQLLWPQGKPATDGPSVQLGIRGGTVTVINRPTTYRITKLHAVCLSARLSPSGVSENQLSW